MKTKLHSGFIALACTGLLAMSATAQTFTTLHSFTALDPNYGTNTDGVNPWGGVVLSGNTLYGTTFNGGGAASNRGYGGTAFRVNTDGTDFTNLHNFSYSPTNSYEPYDGMILSGSTLYGTSWDGGSNGLGTVFKVNTDGTGFTNLYNFAGYYYNDGAEPYGGLVLAGNTLYGTANQGGSNFEGTVFAINTDGTGYTNLHIFAANGYSSSLNAYTNSDGYNPVAGLIVSGNTLYGAAAGGGTNGSGTLFCLNTNGTGFAVLYNFTTVPYYAHSVNSDGSEPFGGLILSSNTLYGTAVEGGMNGYGTVFRVNTDGTDFTNLHNFTAAPAPYLINSDGAAPVDTLVLSGNTLYGTAQYGGTNGYGTVFAVNTDGTDFTNLHNFGAENYSYSLNAETNSDGANPEYAGLIISGNTLYGTAETGGLYGNGTVFSLSLGSVSTPLPQLAIILSGTNVTVTWPTNATGYTLQSTTNLVSPAVWTTNSPAPVVVNTNNVVTNTISGSQQFFRLANP